MSSQVSTILENVNLVAAILASLAAIVMFFERPRNTGEGLRVKYVSILNLVMSFSAAFMMAVGQHFYAMLLYIVFAGFYYALLYRLNTTYNPSADFHKLKSMVFMTPVIICSITFNAVLDVSNLSALQINRLVDLQGQMIERQSKSVDHIYDTRDSLERLLKITERQAEKITNLQEQVVLLSGTLAAVTETQSNLTSTQASFVQIMQKLPNTGATVVDNSDKN